MQNENMYLYVISNHLQYKLLFGFGGPLLDFSGSTEFLKLYERGCVDMYMHIIFGSETQCLLGFQRCERS